MVKSQRTKKRIIVTKRFGRLHVFGILVATLILAISAVSVLSRQTAGMNEPNKPETISAAPKPAKVYVTQKAAGQDVKVDGQDVKVDGQTGEIKPLTPQEAEKLAEGLKPMLNKSSKGLVEIQHSDGSVSMDLQGRFQNVTVARINKDGTTTTSCVDNPRAAGAFFGIDPKQIENAPTRKPKFNPN
jgi:hypothetical protein